MLCHSYTSNARPLLLLSEEEFQVQLDLISSGREDSQDLKFYLRYNQEEVARVKSKTKQDRGSGRNDTIGDYGGQKVSQIFKITKVMRE